VVLGVTVSGLRSIEIGALLMPTGNDRRYLGSGYWVDGGVVRRLSPISASPNQ